VTDAGNDFVFALEAFGIVDFPRGFAAVHHFEHHIAPQAFAAREVHLREIAGRNFLEDVIARQLDSRRRVGRGDGLGRLSGGTALRTGFHDRSQQLIAVMRASGRW
jgi:hypothetical protein